MIFRPPTLDPIRAAELRAWMRRPAPACELCAAAAPARSDELLGPTEERLFRCVGCGRVRRPRSTEPHEFMEARR
jgi:hypothetical protein